MDQHLCILQWCGVQQAFLIQQRIPKAPAVLREGDSTSFESIPTWQNCISLHKMRKFIVSLSFFFPPNFQSQFSYGKYQKEQNKILCQLCRVSLWSVFFCLNIFSHSCQNILSKHIQCTQKCKLSCDLKASGNVPFCKRIREHLGCQRHKATPDTSPRVELHYIW